MDFQFSAVQPSMARNSKATILIHVDDILVVGLKSFWEDVFLKEMKQKFSISHEQLDGVGSSIKFLRRTMTETNDGLVITPGTNVEKLVRLFEKAFGSARAQKTPCDPSIQLPDNSSKLDKKDATSFRSSVGLCLYIARERPDLNQRACMFDVFTHSCSTWSFEEVGWIHETNGRHRSTFAHADAWTRRFASGGAFNWVLESYTDADWSSNRNHRRSTSCGMHFLSSSFAYGSSRSQKVVSLSSCESELHSMVSSMCDGIFIKACAEFILAEEVEHIQYTDSSSARQLACRQGSGRVRHLSGKILWVQEKTQDGSVALRQVGTSENLADIGTKCLTRQRLLYLMHEQV